MRVFSSASEVTRIARSRVLAIFAKKDWIRFSQEPLPSALLDFWLNDATNRPSNAVKCPNGPITQSLSGQSGGEALNEETVEEAVRRHERWLADHEIAIEQHKEAMRKHDEAWQKHEEAILKHDEWREEFWAAMRAATQRADRMDRRLERFERAGTRRLDTLDAKITALTDNQATIQAALQVLIAQVDRFMRGQQRDGHE